jgi:hypothetical protein
MSDPDIYAIRRRARCTQEQFAAALGIPANTVRTRVMAANALLDRGWGKAAQLVAVDGEIRQLVESKAECREPRFPCASQDRRNRRTT